MRVLQIHNTYQVPGGEDAVVASEKELLEAAGHQVEQWIVSNDDIRDLGPVGRARVALAALWSRTSQQMLQERLHRFHPDVVHAHNIMPLLSPSIFRTCREEGVPSILTLHNYRMVCPAAVLRRDGHLCEDCIGRDFAWPGVVHGCYRGSRLQTAVSAAVYGLSRAKGVWSKDVTRFIVLTEFARRLMVRGGLDPDRLTVKPNSVPDPGPGDRGPREREQPYMLYAARLVPEKGISVLLEAWRSAPDLPRLLVAGHGNLAPEVERAAAQDPRIESLGQVDRKGIDSLIRGARAVVVPSQWYEGFPMTIVESLARGTPVVVSALGGMPDMVVDDEGGYTVPSGDPGAIVVACRRLADQATRERLAQGARRAFGQRYSPAANRDQLVACYQEACRGFAAAA